MTVAVVVRDGDAEALTRKGHAYLLRDFREVAVPVVVVDQRRNGVESIRMTVRAHAFLMLSAPDILEIPLKISQDHQIQPTVIVQVHPGCAGGPAAASDTSLRCHVGEGAVSIVVIK